MRDGFERAPYAYQTRADGFIVEGAMTYPTGHRQRWNVPLMLMWFGVLRDRVRRCAPSTIDEEKHRVFADGGIT
jgi:hypothetical protein